MSTDHRAEAERLLEEFANSPAYLLHINDEGVSPEQAESIRDRWENLTGQRPVITAPPIQVERTAPMLAALTHAVLHLAEVTS